MKRTSARKGGEGLSLLVALVLLALVPLALPAPSSADPLRQGTTTLVSTFPGGTPADGAFPSVSKDGRYVAFESFEPLTEDDTDSFEDVYRKDMATGETVLVSPNVAGVPFARDNAMPSISADGNKVAYLSGICFSPEFSLAGCSGLYAHVRDVAQGTTTLASNHEYRVESAQLSRDGEWTALVDESEGSYAVTAVENATGKYTRLVFICGGCVAFPLIGVSETGRYVAFESNEPHVPGDLDLNWDVYRLDRDPDENGVFDEPGKSAFVLASVLPAPIGGHPYGVSPAISEDGNVVGFNGAPWLGSFAAGFNTYARDISAAATTVVSQNSFAVPGVGAGAGDVMSLSSNGRYVAFASYEPHMALGDANPGFDVFLRDRQEGRTYLVSILPDGTQGVGDRIDPSISGDGRFIAFQAALIGRNRLDRNRRVYLRDRQPPCSIACLLEP